MNDLAMQSNESDRENVKVVSGKWVDVRNSREVQYVFEKEGRSFRVLRCYRSDGSFYYIYPDNYGQPPFGKEEKDPIGRFYKEGYTLRWYRSTSVVEKEFQKSVDKS